jgi:hypothetical protein
MPNTKPENTAAPDADGASSAGEDLNYVQESDAEYRLEYPVVCPSCRATVQTLWAIRLLRTRVNFTSMLPRHGRVVICPNCRAVLSADLTIA